MTSIAAVTADIDLLHAQLQTTKDQVAVLRRQRDDWEVSCGQARQAVWHLNEAIRLVTEQRDEAVAERDKAYEDLEELREVNAEIRARLDELEGEQ